MQNKPLVSIIVPTWNNREYLFPFVVSVIRNSTAPDLFEIVVVNNGHPNSCDYLKDHKQIRVINAGSNLGWEGGIDLGFKNTESPFVIFMNDDTLVPQSSRNWINQMLQHFKDPKVAAVGPASNTVMGNQNIFADVQFSTFEAKFIIGFCAMIRRSAFEEIGGMDMGLPGGDDLDWSIRLRDAGYKILVDKDVFIFHHGFKSGERLNGPASVANGWNSYEMYSKTNTALIKKHGLKKWYDTMSVGLQPPKFNYKEQTEDMEGNVIRKLIKKTDKNILDIGCGNNKTLKRAAGVDFVKRGTVIRTLDGFAISQADVEADVSKELPFPDDSQDVIIARHVLEHMIDPVSALIFWMKKLRKSGKLIIAVPNEEWHRTISMNSEHVHAYTPETLGVLLSALGLKVEIHNSLNSISFIAVAEKI